MVNALRLYLGSNGFIVLAACLAALGCRGAPPAPPEPPPPVASVTQPIDFPVQSYYEYNGYLDSVESVQVRARVKGVLEEFRFTEGDEVKKGDLLYRIDPREYEAAELKAKSDISKAEADAANAKAQIRLTKAEVDRQQKTYNSGAGAVFDLDKAQANLAAAQAQLDVAAANREAGESALRTARLDLEYTQIKAPIDGRISRTLVTPGNLVGQNETTLLTTIVRMDELYVYYDAAERDLIEYQRTPSGAAPGAKGPATLPVEFGVATEKGFPHRGVIDFRENRVETSTGTVRIRGRVANPIVEPGRHRLLYPGLFARIRVPSGPLRTLPVIPEDALMTGQEGQFVYVLGEGNVVQKRSVTVVPQHVWKAESQQGPTWTLAAPVPPPGGAPSAGAAPGAGGPPPGAGGPPPGPVPVRSVVAVAKGLTRADRVLVTGLTKSRPGAPVTPEHRELQQPAPEAK
ncbi:Efflux pump periplasmic linker BepD precursor [Gemmata obscuriglobus]|uniref:Multidrug resistance protein MdtA-like barrel-sandwich hybrid domain-containing protein n=1 Tax=Gemmata obscuriglobus TaxID=114 RepID=A0A2Z3H0D3_9BACT|nr:efflux RND transporter periplasmic adaptor subunit [Gemmata obscuriglobus]AWM37762.1 hypothetical protein C1280_12660 [Gemmata obscuriglobus]QEG29426.1 Efflux pump periplasmic linker BepD precursor [Gemmata obscuriglobus]VTS08526.1 acriflavin resistance protein : RND family efflux transporter, MFP subunit OS=Singulisphaera acidiphila (strain ATCC BAA-1392 / DSM 18658 / VKM B-2454 / MOB10) GN=Sinac_6016 PE=4 SV=1: HlyD [Gemmata obscuriglobus UQM 2246]